RTDWPTACIRGWSQNMIGSTPPAAERRGSRGLRARRAIPPAARNAPPRRVRPRTRRNGDELSSLGVKLCGSTSAEPPSVPSDPVAGVTGVPPVVPPDVGPGVGMPPLYVGPGYVGPP